MNTDQLRTDFKCTNKKERYVSSFAAQSIHMKRQERHAASLHHASAPLYEYTRTIALPRGVNRKDSTASHTDRLSSRRNRANGYVLTRRRCRSLQMWVSGSASSKSRLNIIHFIASSEKKRWNSIFSLSKLSPNAFVQVGTGGDCIPRCVCVIERCVQKLEQ